MFNFRNLLRIAFDFDHRPIIVLYKSTKTNPTKSKFSVIKTFNTENKLLYGDLIETQKQRRAKILKNKDNEEEYTSEYVISSVDGPVHDLIDETEEKALVNKKTRILEKSKKETISDNLFITEETGHKKCLNSDINSDTVYSDIEDSETSALKNNSADLLCNSFFKNENNISSKSEIILNSIKNRNVASNLETDTKFSESPKSEDFQFSNLVDFPLENSEKDFSFSEHIGEIQNLTLDDPQVKSKFLNFPSVSKVISATMSEASRAALKRWRTKMISELGEEGFQAHYKAQLNRGSEFHESIKKKLMGEAVSSSNEAVIASLSSLQWVLPLIGSTVAIETHVAHSRLRYRGIIDCVAEFKGTPVVIEWKLSDKPKPNIQDTYDAPIQLCAYVGALNYDSNFKFQINNGLVVVAYSSGSPADAFFLGPKHCDAYWKIWLDRLNKFNNMERLHTNHEVPTLP